MSRFQRIENPFREPRCCKNSHHSGENRRCLSNRSQAVRLPKEYQFDSDEVFIRKVGDDVILSPCPRDWRTYLESAPVASQAFMAEVEDLSVQEREV